MYRKDGFLLKRRPGHLYIVDLHIATIKYDKASTTWVFLGMH